MKNAERTASQTRIQAAQEETQRIVATGHCPFCGSGIRRNSSISGWWQCEQFGAPAFRARADEEDCHWQGFTH